MGISMILDDFLYLGAAKDTKDVQLMKKIGITHIISCAGTVISPENYTIINEKFEDDEQVDISNQIENVYWFIEKVRINSINSKNGNKVFIHCMAGKSRSASIVISYLLKRGYHSLSDCLFFVHSRRLEIRPNDGFMNQLIDLEFKLTNNESLSKIFKEWRSLQSLALKTKFEFNPTTYTGIIKTDKTIHNKSKSTSTQTKEHEQLLLKLKSVTDLFFSINLPKDIVLNLYDEQCKVLSSSSVDIQYFSKTVQDYLSKTTNKANEFILNHYYLEWRDIVLNLSPYLDLIINSNNN